MLHGQVHCTMYIDVRNRKLRFMFDKIYEFEISLCGRGRGMMRQHRKCTLTIYVVRTAMIRYEH